MHMSQHIKRRTVRAGVAVLLVSNVCFGFPLDMTIAIINDHIAKSKIVDALYLALHEENVIDRDAIAIPTAVPRVHAATVSVQMAERYVGARSNTTTAISNYSFSWQAPTGIAALTVEARGGGGGGGGSSATNNGGGGGGGGGGYAYSTGVSVSAGSSYTVDVGRGGNGGSTTGAGGAGTNSAFNSTTVVADAGNGGGAGANGTAGTGGTVNTGGTTFNGGAGSTGVASTRSGAGGGGAGDGAVGGAASGTTGGTGGSAGGGDGAAGRAASQGVGNPATAVYGGGGGGGYRVSASQAGGAGASGLIDLDYSYDADNTYPIIRGISGSRTNNVNGTSHAITLPPDIQAGDLLIVIFSVDANETVSINTGVSGNNWTVLATQSNSTTVTGSIIYKVAEGGDALTLTTTTEQSSHLVYRIANYSGVPTATASTGTTNIDPPLHTPAGGTDNYLWIATRSGDSTTAATAAPSGYSFWRQADAPGTGGAATDAAVLFANGSSENPGTWTNGAVAGVSFTISIAGAAAEMTAPQDLITTSTNAGVNLNWTAPSSPGASSLETYGVWRSTVPFTATTSAALIASISAAGTTYSDTSAAHGTTYYYRVSATNSTATSSLSNQRSSNANNGRIVRMKGVRLR